MWMSSRSVQFITITEITRNDVCPLSSSRGLGVALCESSHVGIQAVMWKVEEVLEIDALIVGGRAR